MKKILVILLSFLILVLAVGCTVGPSGNGGTDENPTETPDNPSEEPDNSPFTVSLIYNGEPFGVYTDEGTTALWTQKDENDRVISVVEAKFNTKGVASIDGLDGNYTVTLKNLRNGYTYNPNHPGNIATSENKNVTIEVYRLGSTLGTGTGWYGSNVLNLPKVGAYRLTITGANHKLYCQYAPPSEGEYFIESIVDTTANELNPRIDVYNANGGWVDPDGTPETINEGGASSVFTKNFKYNISSYSNTFVCAFILTCDSRVGYPVDVDIIISREGNYDFGDDDEYTLYIPKEEFKQTPNYNGAFRYMVNDDSNGVLRSDRIAFNEADGYYHLTDSDGVITSTILYAKISGAIIAPNGVEVVNFQDLYDLDAGERGVNLYINGLNYTFMIQGYKGLVSIRYDNAEEFVNRKTYIDYVNNDGVYAVTQELKEFLQAYSSKNQFFYDGSGWAETNGYNSNDANQWLFACGYYTY